MIARLLRAVLFGGSLAVASLLPFVRHAREALPLGTLTGAQQRAFWLPWELADNVGAGRGALDASVFAWGGDRGLLALVGNPGAAFVLAPLHVALPQVAAHNVGLVVLAASNGVAFALWGRSAASALAAAALGACSAWWAVSLGGGAYAAGWVAPGVAAAWCQREGFDRAGAVVGVLGALASPVPTAAALIASALAPRGAGARIPVTGLGIAAIALLVRAFAPPLGAGVDSAALPLGALAWPGVRAAAGLSLVVLAGLALLWREQRAMSLAVGLSLLLAMGPVAIGEDGAPIAGFDVTLLPVDVGGARLELVSAVLVVAAIAVVRALAGMAAPVCVAVAALLAVEPQAQAALGQPVSLWTGARWPVPAALVELGASPRARVLLQLPLVELRDGMVGWIPFHRQRVVNGANVDVDGAAREAVLAALRQDPSLGVLAHLRATGASFPLVPGIEPGAVAPALVRLGVTDVVVHGQDASTLAGAQALFGSPASVAPDLTRWRLTP